MAKKLQDAEIDEQDQDLEKDEDEDEGDDDLDTEEETTEEEEEGKQEEKPSSQHEKVEALIQENADLRSEVDELRKIAEKATTNIEAAFPNPVRLGEQPLYSMTESEYLDALEIIPADQTDLYKQALAERRQYLKKNLPALEAAKQLEKSRLELWTKEWENVRDLFLADYPDLKSGIPALDKKLNEDLANPGKLALLESSIQAKVRWVAKSIKELGLIKGSEKPKIGTTQSSSKPASTGTGKKKSFTRAEIAAMSQAEYDKNEKAIDAALRAGKIK